MFVQAKLKEFCPGFPRVRISETSIGPCSAGGSQTRRIYWSVKNILGNTTVVLNSVRHTSELKVTFVVLFSSVYVLQSLYTSGSFSVHLE